ncbi:hypothetical protein Naga_101267g1 [Nannochloropsis gaditana]|uniref:Secreted protein n=1 Tax=Nannochloropsis gaditana TaxID=72520 RepID=W7TZH6_9STRA|nr:hypothetical protein Naga_101267g1 [Nannochloropsis gaditana]
MYVHFTTAFFVVLPFIFLSTLWSHSSLGFPHSTPKLSQSHVAIHYCSGRKTVPVSADCSPILASRKGFEHPETRGAFLPSQSCNSSFGLTRPPSRLMSRRVPR